MKCRDIKNISFSTKAWKKILKNKESNDVTGLDTETEKGQVFIIGIRSKRHKAIMRIKKFEDFIHFCQFFRLHKTDNFFYNMTYDSNAIIKLLPMKQLEELGIFDETKYGESKIELLPNKKMTITFNNKKYHFYDLAQFYDHLPLKIAGEKELRKSKLTLESSNIDIKNLSSERYDNDKIYREEIDKYLHMDCELCFNLVERLIEKAKPFLFPKYFYSQASLSQQYFLENMDRDFKILPTFLLNYGLQAYNGGRFEVFKRGTFKNVSCYDIRSAYPYHNSKIPALDTGKWINNTEYDETSLLSLYYGEVEGYSHISPLRHENKNGLFYPVGKKNCYFNKTEYETFLLYGYKVKILNAYHYHDENPTYPFKFLEKFYYKKEEVGKNHPSYKFYKIIINGFYGKTIQLEADKIEVPESDSDDFHTIMKNLVFTKDKYKAGLLFNPVIAQEITANTRCQLLKAVVNIQKNVIAFATDSIIVHDVTPSLVIGSSLGEWDREKHNKTFTSVGSGVYFFEGSMMKFRGFGRELNPEEVFTDLESDKIGFPVKRNVKLKKFIRSSVFTKEHFNLILDDYKTQNLNFDHKRVWDRDIINVNDLFNNQIESKPININDLYVMEDITL